VREVEGAGALVGVEGGVDGAAEVGYEVVEGLVGALEGSDGW
jgi:hypothetical protein